MGTMVDSWYDKGTRINDNDGSWIVKSWYDNGVRLTEGPPIPAGMSAAAAARSPELVKAALKCESEIAMLRFRLDSMPSAGTMFGVLKGKLKIAEYVLARTIDQAREAVQAMDDAEGDLLTQRIEALQKEIEEVVAEVETSKAEAAAAAEDWGERRVRLQADFDNLRARNANQTDEAQLTATVKVVQDFLPVLDNLDRARTSIKPEGDEAEAASARYEQVYDTLMAALAEMGVETIPTVGEAFDYNLHMAIQTVPSDEFEEDKVAEEMQAGFTCQGRLVRPAYVMVSSG